MAAPISPPTKYASKRNTTINDLYDDSLIEIFCRLPWKTLFSCKSVSKHWFALVSDPNFRSIYLTFQNLQTKGEDLNQQGFILEPYINALVTMPNVSFSQLGSLMKLEVFGCSNGLLLCRNPRRKCIYYVCNPLTRDTLELPAPSLRGKTGVLLGFMCDPYYHVEGEGVSIVTSLRRFRVLRIPTFSGMKFTFNVEVFSSETGKWNHFVVSCPKGFECGFFLPKWGVEQDGKLYFTGKRTILVYDPYNDPKAASVIDYPSDFVREAYTGCLGVSCGRLHLSELRDFETPDISFCLRVWELEYCDCGQIKEATWQLVHEFYLPPNIIGPILQELTPIQRKSVSGYARIIAFHPYARGNVFLRVVNHIISCNLLTRRFKAIKYGGQLSLLFYPVIPIVLPWWPTPFWRQVDNISLL